MKDQQILNIGDSMVVNTEINENRSIYENEVEKDVSIIETNIDSVVENNKTKRRNKTYNKQKGLSDAIFELKQSNFKKKIYFD